MTEPETTTTVAPKRLLLTAVLMAAAAAVGALVASGIFLIVGRADSPPLFEISGKVVLNGGYGGDCPQLSTATVHVLDKTGVVIAVGRAERGRQLSDNRSCVHPFSVTDVPTGHAVYGVVMLGMNEVPVFFTEPVLRAKNPVELAGTYRRPDRP